MLHPAPRPDQVEQIHELNRLFLTLLQQSLLHGRDRYGLPPGAARMLRQAVPARLDTAAAFPKALFRLHIDPAPRARDRLDPLGPQLGAGQVAVSVTILLSAWNLSRHSAYQARLFLGLDGATIRALQALPLSELPPLARSPRLLSCAFRHSEDLWASLLGHDGRRVRELALIALQPEPARADRLRRTLPPSRLLSG